MRGARPEETAFWVAVAPAPGEYKESEEEMCYLKSIHIHRQGL